MLVRFDFSDRSGSDGTDLSIRDKMYLVAILTLSMIRKRSGSAASTCCTAQNGGLQRVRRDRPLVYWIMRLLPSIRFARFRCVHIKIEELCSAWQIVTLHARHGGDPMGLERTLAGVGRRFMPPCRRPAPRIKGKLLIGAKATSGLPGHSAAGQGQHAA